MKQTDFPDKITLPFGINAGSSYLRPIPQASSDQSAASYQAGFPAATFKPTTAGGTGPDGRDFNGILFAATGNILRLLSQGLTAYDQGFQQAINGYPKGAVVLDPSLSGLSWLSLQDNNVSTPGAPGTLNVTWAVQNPSNGRLLDASFLTNGSGTYVWPAFTSFLRVRGIGGGGAGGYAQGGGSGGATSSGGAGGTGAYVEFTIATAALSPTGVRWTAGAGGVPNTNGNAGAGGASTFNDNNIVLGGGSGGHMGAPTTKPSAASQAFGGAVTTNGTSNMYNFLIQRRGSSGPCGLDFGGSNWPALGVDTVFGTGGANANVGPGGDATGYGASGAGAGSGAGHPDALGGAGAPGCWVIEAYS